MLLPLMCAILIACQIVASQQSTPELSVLVTEAANPEILLRIRNSSPTAKMLCVRSSSLQADGRGYGSSIPHGCQSRVNFAVVLPGESHVVPAIDVSMQLSGKMAVTAAVVVSELGGDFRMSQEHRIRWEGETEEARAAFRSINGR